jgi:hypothetical protein
MDTHNAKCTGQALHVKDAEWTTNKLELNVIDFTVIMRWKLLFMNGCECRRLISARMIVNSSQN